MAGVSQQIPSYYGGISEQADQLKRPGQVKDVVNAIPDITWGLYKRPGSKRIGTNKLTNVQSNGSWFHYYRDETEGSYIGQIASDGKVRVWSCNDGTEKNVWYHTDNAIYDSGNPDHTAITTYLTPSSATATEDLQALTINDTTYLTNRTKVVTTTGTTTAKPDAYSAYIEILRTENGRQYGLNISTPDGLRDDTLNRATRVKITSDTLDESSGTGNCPGIGTQVFSKDDGDKKNLIFRITSLGQVSNVEGSSTSFKCTYNREIDLLHGGEGWETNDEVTVTLDQAQTNYDYVIQVTDHETATLKADVKLVRPAPTPFDAETAVTLDTVLGGIKTELAGVTVDGAALNVEIIGNGLYLSCTNPFVVEGTDADLMRVMQSEINDVTNLPNQCKQGYIVKVTNARMAEEDDYYLKFVGEQSSSGTGSWIECAAPGIIKSFNASTMPHILQRQADGDFLLKAATWADREVGDDATNQAPSFVGDPTYTSNGIATYSEDRKINKVLFFRNRLAFLSGENVILSRPGNFSTPNFWAETALTVSAVDPIDISSSSMFPSDLFDGIEVTVGLVVFSSNQQFLLASDDTVLNPDTAKLKSISAFNYNTVIPPVSLGMSVGYIDNSGKYSRFNEMSVIERERDPVIVETSKLVPSLLPKDIDLITNSRENQIVLFSNTASKIVYGFKYLFTGEQRPQTSWFKWKLNQNLIYHFIIDDVYYFLDSDDFLQQINLVQDTDESITEDDVNYLVHLDNYVANVTGGVFNTGTNITTFNTTWLADVSSSTNDVAIIDADGRYGKGTRDGNALEVVGDWSSATVDIGFLYDYEVDFPTLYVSSSDNNIFTSDANSSLVVHRIKLNFGKVGSYETTLTSKVGKDPYTEIYESNTLDAYEAGDAPYLSEKIKTIPVYERNTNVDITLKSTNPSPATLHSMSWEGDYTQRFYKRV
tara:strand:+ start:1527 stop:4337 length:2811 start_codon:yes stop_codon:yes gene_type:complete